MGPKTLRKIMRFLVPRLIDLETTGLQNFPATGSGILAANHLSRLDAPIALSVIQRDDVTALVAEKYQTNILLSWFTNSGRGIYIDRSKADYGAFNAAVKYIKDGHVLGVAPEGTRSGTRELIEGKSGIVLMALKADALIIPLAFIGTEYAVKKILRLQRPRVRLRFGMPFKLPPINQADRSEYVKRNTDEIMCRIASLLPEEYRGVYRNHPRLKELLHAQPA